VHKSVAGKTRIDFSQAHASEKCDHFGKEATDMEVCAKSEHAWVAQLGIAEQDAVASYPKPRQPGFSRRRHTYICQMYLRCMSG
jgi:hypothetical protein